MSHLKTATSALTAALLVTGIGLAVAQTDEPQQPADPTVAATPAPLSEQTPADPNALPPADDTAQMQPPQTPPAVEPAPATMPAQPAMDNTYPSANVTTAAPGSSGVGSEPAPRADRN